MFDYFLRSRSEADLEKRVHLLLNNMDRDMADIVRKQDQWFEKDLPEHKESTRKFQQRDLELTRVTTTALLGDLRKVISEEADKEAKRPQANNQRGAAGGQKSSPSSTKGPAGAAPGGSAGGTAATGAGGTAGAGAGPDVSSSSATTKPRKPAASRRPRTTTATGLSSLTAGTTSSSGVPPPPVSRGGKQNQSGVITTGPVPTVPTSAMLMQLASAARANPGNPTAQAAFRAAEEAFRAQSQQSNDFIDAQMRQKAIDSKSRIRTPRELPTSRQTDSGGGGGGGRGGGGGDGLIGSAGTIVTAGDIVNSLKAEIASEMQAVTKLTQSINRQSQNIAYGLFANQNQGGQLTPSQARDNAQAELTKTQSLAWEKQSRIFALNQRLEMILNSVGSGGVDVATLSNSGSGGSSGGSRVPVPPGMTSMMYGQPQQSFAQPSFSVTPSQLSLLQRQSHHQMFQQAAMGHQQQQQQQQQFNQKYFANQQQQIQHLNQQIQQQQLNKQLQQQQQQQGVQGMLPSQPSTAVVSTGGVFEGGGSDLSAVGEKRKADWPQSEEPQEKRGGQPPSSSDSLPRPASLSVFNGLPPPPPPQPPT